MKTIDQFIRQVNLVMTDTITQDEFCYVDFDINKVQVNKKDCINLLYLLKQFNELYLSFLKDQPVLDGLNIAKSIEVLRYYETDNYRSIRLYLVNPIICDYQNIVLVLKEENNQISSILTNCVPYGNRNCFRKRINLDEEQVRFVLDTFKRHDRFIEMYYSLKNNMIYGDGITVLGSKIYGNTIHNLSDFEICIGNSYFNYSDFILLSSRLGHNFAINYDNCELTLESTLVPVDSKTVDKLLNEVCINKKYIKRR